MNAQDAVTVRNALISCHDKTGLKYLAAELVKLNPDIRIYCSSGTYNELKKAVNGKNIIEISEYTGTKEMPAGLVKTLHPKVHAGILADINDDAQKKHLAETGGVAFDLVAVNLYPFAEAAGEGSIEKARTNIDIGGVSLIEAAAKNFLRVSVVVSPIDYEKIIEEVKKNGGCGLDIRLRLAKAAMNYLTGYISNISGYYDKLTPAAVRKEYKDD